MGLLLKPFLLREGDGRKSEGRRKERRAERVAKIIYVLMT